MNKGAWRASRSASRCTRCTDSQLMAAARDWRYRPATAGGVPVKYRKLIEIVLDKR